MNTYKAQAVVEVTLKAADRHEASHLVSRTLDGLDAATGGRVRGFDYAGEDAVRRDLGELHSDYRRAGDEAFDSASVTLRSAARAASQIRTEASRLERAFKFAGEDAPVRELIADLRAVADAVDLAGDVPPDGDARHVRQHVDAN